jgi:hypothetical protein
LQADFFILVDIRTFITFLETVIARTWNSEQSVYVNSRQAFFVHA